MTEKISLHKRFLTFIGWIRPDPDTVDNARTQRDEVRSRISAKAEADGLTVRSTPNSGSFAKGTGLRRHMRGGAEHEGQDIDCSFVVSQEDEDGNVLDELLSRFDAYAQTCYPDTPRERTRSSVWLRFVATKRHFDLVPLLAVEGRDDEQVLLRSNGERRRTSVQKHVAFIRTRTAKSQVVAGPVVFNDGVRLVKWWREYQVTQSEILDEVPTFLVDLLCAKAFDEVSVQQKWPETMRNWFDRIQAYAASRATISFNDFTAAHPAKLSDAWSVIDPVNGENNVVPSVWAGYQIDELRDWATVARDKLQRAIALEMVGRDAEAVALVAEVFGPSFKNHSEE